VGAFNAKNRSDNSRASVSLFSPSLSKASHEKRYCPANSKSGRDLAEMIVMICFTVAMFSYLILKGHYPERSIKLG
jgi:hypothetical protein